MLNIYITNLGKYNEGKLMGAWVHLPINMDEQYPEILKSIGINEEYEEYFITDYETDLPVPINEYENVEQLNRIAEKIEQLNINDTEKLKAVLEWEYYGDDIEKSIDNIDDFALIDDIKNEYDYGKYIVDDLLMCSNELKAIEYYIDYEKLGRDYIINSDGSLTNYGYVEYEG